MPCDQLAGLLEFLDACRRQPVQAPGRAARRSAKL